MDAIVDDVSNSENLKLPARMSKAPLELEDKRKYLVALLSHDPGVFLERHGKLLSANQRSFFEPLRKDSYEVDFYLKLLEDEEHVRMANPEVELPALEMQLKRILKI